MATSLYYGTYTATYPGVMPFAYYGHVTRYYLDYLDQVTGQTLVAVPGGSYAMAPVNSRAGLTVPPPDGEWTPPAVFMITWRPPGRVVKTLAEVRADLERSRAARGWYIPPPAPPGPPHAAVPAVPVREPDRVTELQRVRARLALARGF